MKPTIGRIVHFTGDVSVSENGGANDVYPGIVTAVRDGGVEGDRARFGDDDERQYVVDIVTFGRGSMYFHNDVEFNAHCVEGTWHWPPPVVPR